MVLPSLRLLHESPASMSWSRVLLTVVGQVSLVRSRMGLIGRRRLNFGRRISILCSKTLVFSGGVCRSQQSHGFRTFNIASCRISSRQLRDGVVMLAFASRLRLVGAFY